MKRRMFLLIVLLFLVFGFSACGSNCVTGKVQNMYEQDNKYYVVLSEEKNLQFTGNSIVKEVNKEVYFRVFPADLVTICK